MLSLRIRVDIFLHLFSDCLPQCEHVFFCPSEARELLLPRVDLWPLLPGAHARRLSSHIQGVAWGIGWEMGSWVREGPCANTGEGPQPLGPHCSLPGPGISSGHQPWAAVCGMWLLPTGEGNLW